VDRHRIHAQPRGLQVLLRERWDTLKVLVTGSPEKRAQRVQSMLETHDHALAQKTLCEWDADRRAFYDRCYHIDWLSPLNYDLCLNTDHMSEPEAIATVVEAARQR
jgi:cytidylate kinase